MLCNPAHWQISLIRCRTWGEQLLTSLEWYPFEQVQSTCTRKASDSLVKQAETARLRWGGGDGKEVDQGVTLHIGFPAHQYYQLTIMYKHQEMQRRGDFPKPSGCSAWVGLMVTSCNLQLTTDFGLVLGLVLVAILLKMSLLAPKRAHMWQKFICLANPLCDLSKPILEIVFLRPC